MRAYTQALSTFDQIFTFTPRRVAECDTIRDVSAAVVDAVSSGLKVRAFGAGQSWAHHVVTNDVCVNLLRLNRIHYIDTINKTITVDAGVRLRDVTNALASYGLCLPSLSFNPEVTIGGAVATGTHGTSHKWGTLSDFVISMDVVLPSGKVKTFGPNSRPEELFAARTAVGMLGVIVRLELQAIAMPLVRHSEFNVDLTEFRNQLPSILVNHDHVWAHWNLGTDSVRVECLECRAEPAEGFHRYVDGGNGCWRPPSNIATRLWYSNRGRAVELLRRMRNEKILSMQYGVPRRQLETAINRIEASNLSAAHSDRVIELKFIKGKGCSYLGPNTDGDAVLFNLWWLVDEVDRFAEFAQFENVMRSIHARPHWGKLHSPPDVDYMSLAYPEWATFHELQTRYDPSGAFSIFHPAGAAGHDDRQRTHRDREITVSAAADFSRREDDPHRYLR
jgi:L-gulono-1,4-lactone dehydrogenase